MKDKIAQAYEVLAMVLKSNSPYDTGRLSTTGIKIEEDGILIGGGKTYYAVYTEEPWISPKWNGKSNPNEGWIEKSIQQALPMIKDIFNGTVTRDDVTDYMDEQQLKYIATQDEKGVTYYDI